MILTIKSEEKYYKFWFIFAFIVWLLFAYWATRPPVFDGHDPNQPDDRNNEYDTLGRP